MTRIPNILPILIPAILFSCSGEQAETLDKKMKEKPVPVYITEIRSQDLPIVVDTIGRLVPNRQVIISAEVGGLVQGYNADLGDQVVKGQILIEIDPTDYRLALKEAKANLKVAETHLVATQKSFERTKSLPKHVIAPDNFEKVEADFKSSKATVERVKVLVDINKEKLEKTLIKAPFPGFILERVVEKGQFVGIGQPLINLVDLDPIRAKVYLPEKDYIHLDKEDKVSVSLEACPDLILKARIDRIGIKADEMTNTFDVEILVDNPDYFLKAGMTARVNITVDTIKRTVMIPQSSVLYRKDRMEVFVVGKGNRAEVREVELGRSKGSLVQIHKGLIPGDQLIVTGGQYLKEGDLLEISHRKGSGPV